MFHLLLYVADILSTLIDREQRPRPIRIEFVTLQANLTHTYGEPSHPHNSSPFFSCHGTGPPPSTTEYQDSAPAQ